MGKKYIIELEEKETAYKTVNSDGRMMIGLLHPVPYTEPDLEQVRKEVYDKGYDDCRDELNLNAIKNDSFNNGYECGLDYAWKAARTIIEMEWEDKNKIFGKDVFLLANIFSDNTAAEAIEKLKQYEREQDTIQVGDEVKCDDERYVVLQKYLNNIDELMVVLFNRRDGDISVFHLYNGNGVIFEKTGKYFPEIVAVFEKMRGE